MHSSMFIAYLRIGRKKGKIYEHPSEEIYLTFKPQSKVAKVPDHPGRRHHQR